MFTGVAIGSIPAQALQGVPFHAFIQRVLQGHKRL